MIAVGRANCFRAAVAGAVPATCSATTAKIKLINGCMATTELSAYDDPAAYIRNSAITYVKQVKTPTLLLVGKRDEEAPPRQSFEFWHALKEIGVPSATGGLSRRRAHFENYKNRVDLIAANCRLVRNAYAGSRPGAESSLSLQESSRLILH